MKRTFNLLVLVTLLALTFGAQGAEPARAAGTGKVYAFTHFCYYDIPYFAVYDVATDTWTDLNQYGTCAMMAVAQDGTLYAYGQSSGQIDVYDPGTDTWSAYRSAPPVTPSAGNWGNLEITTGGVFLYTQQNSNNLYYATGSGGAWTTVPLSFNPSMQGDYDPSTNQYVVGEYNSMNAHLIDISTFAVTDFTALLGFGFENKPFGVVMGGRYYYQAGYDPIYSVNLSNPVDNQAHGSGISWMMGAADRASGIIYVAVDYTAQHFYSFDPATGVYTPLANYTNLNYMGIVYASGSTPSDTTPPMVYTPSDLTEEATSSSGAVVTFSTTATDETSPAAPVVTCDWNSGDTFPLGTTPVTCWATDDAFNTGYGYFNVTVEDTTPPTTYWDSTPPSLTNSTSADFTFHSDDLVSDSANIEHVCFLDAGPDWFICSSPLNLSGLSEGFHFIWMYANDEAGNSNYGPGLIGYGWTIDLTAPVFALVADNPYEATGPTGAIALYNASFSDDNGIASQSCTPASGSLFPLGPTTTNCTATDNAGNTSNFFFEIIVVDSTAPTLTLPADITVPQNNPSGATVPYIATANDIVDASPSVVCTPASGSNFPLGTTQVNCSATDDFDNTSYDSFNVTVFAWTAGTFTSVGGYDGTFIETNETSGIGTAPNIPGGFLDAGDTVLSNRQTLNVMHFDTSTLPDGAVVLGLSIQVKQYQIVGTNPMTTHGNLNVDIVSPFFGTGMSLVASDFQAPASAANVGFFNTTPLPGNWFQAVLDSGAFPFLNLTGSTQLRAHFTLDDDNDGRADLFRVYSGNSPLAANRPVLTVYYYIP